MSSVIAVSHFILIHVNISDTSTGTPVIRMTRVFSCSFILLLLLVENVISENAYLGCFFDKFDSETLVLPLGHGTHHKDMTVGKCINQCLDFPNDTRYAGVEAGSQCWCGTQDAQYDQYGERPDSECDEPCRGDMNQTCGADFRIAVYDLFLVGCQLSDLVNGNVKSSSGDFVPVRMFATFTCLPGHVLDGTDIAQCIIGNSINDIGWDSQLPLCMTAAKFATSTAITEDGTSSMMSPIIKKTPLSSTITIAGVASGAGITVFVILSILIIIQKRRTSGVSLDCCEKEQTHITSESSKPVDETYFGLDASTRQPDSVYQEMAQTNDLRSTEAATILGTSPQKEDQLQDNTYQGLDASSRQPDSTYQEMTNSNDLKNTDNYLNLDPISRQEEEEYQDVTGLKTPSELDSDQNSEYQEIIDSKTTVSNNKNLKQVPIPPPIQHDLEIDNCNGYYVNV